MSPKPRNASARPSLLGRALGALVKLVVTLFAVAVPLLGVWVATSLAVYLHGPLWLAIAAGVALALALPWAWELWAEARRNRPKKKPPERILTRFDRLVLRTLALNLTFLAVVLFAYPRQGFTALSTRGDWMLGEQRGGAADTVRDLLFAAAGGLEWLYDAATDNRYAAYADASPPPSPSTPSPPPADGPAPVDPLAPADPLAPGAAPWPLPPTLHPAVTAMPAAAQASLDAAGRYFAATVPNPRERVKALHDFATLWLAYDAEGLAHDALPPQDAESVFAARKAVCAGYARLLVALGERTGDHIVYLLGQARTAGGDLDGVGHAWNAVELDGAWHLLDATWDAGTVEGATFTARYRTDYLFTPPAVFALDHFPEDPAWQLLATPLSRGDFLRQPALAPSFFARGLTLVSPTRSQTDVAADAELVLDNPRGQWVLAVAVDRRSGAKLRCGEATADPRPTLRCALPAAGRYQVELFANAEQYGSFEGLGYVEVQRGG